MGVRCEYCGSQNPDNTAGHACCMCERVIPLSAAPDDAFDAIEPEGKKSVAIEGPVTVSVIALPRSGVLRVAFLLDKELAGRVAGDGWPRFSAAFSPGMRAFRIKGQAQGPYECFKPARGERIALRVPVPKGLTLRAYERLEADYCETDGALTVKLPKVFDAPAVKALPAPVDPKVIGKPANDAKPVSAQEAARRAVPAPKF